MPDASIVIVTRNRRDTACVAVQSSIDQAGDNEVIVLDDASDDATADCIRSRFPTVRVERYERQGGLILRRNQAVANAKSPIVFSLDDDAVFTDPTIVQKIVEQFDHPAVGAIAIPFVNHYDGSDHQDFANPPDTTGDWITNTFIGTAFAVRKDIFMQLAGFQSVLFHWAEEGEYCQRMFAAGFTVRAGRSASIRHFPKGVGKYRRKVNRYIYRNLILSAWFNAPFRYFLLVLPVAMLRGIRAMIKKPGEAAAVIEGTTMGFLGIAHFWSLRHPLRLDRYRFWLEVRARKFVPLQEVESRMK